MNRFTGYFGLTALIALTLAAGCGSERPTDPDLEVDLQVADLWPSADGNSWTYRLRSSIQELPDPGIYPTLADVPPCPTLDELHADLQQSQALGADGCSERTLRLRLQGEVPVGPSLVVQHLVASLEGGDDGNSKPFPLRGGPWRLDDTGIVEFSYNRAHLDTTWVHLTDRLTPGTTVSCSVCYLIACNCCQHVRVWRRFNQDVGDLGTTPCLEVLYLFEWGVSVATNDDHEIVGYYRRYVYGTVTFARNVGPIRCRERMMLAGSHGLTTTKVVDMEAALVRFDVTGR